MHPVLILLLLCLCVTLQDAVDFSQNHCLEYDHIPNMWAQYSGKWNDKCFRDVPISFESCRLLLSSSHSCNIMTFRNKLCSLLDSTSPGYHETRKIGEDSILVRKTKKSLGECLDTRKYIPAVQKFRRCMKASQTTKIPTDHLPFLAIVVSVTSEWADSHKAGVASMRSNMECYCAAHNYHFVSTIPIFTHSRNSLIYRCVPN